MRRVLLATVLASVMSIATLVGTAVASSAAAGAVPGSYVAVASTPLFDTRSGLRVPQRAIAAGGSVTVSVPASLAPPQAILALHLVVASSTANGWIATFPAGGSSSVSAVNYTQGQQQSNLTLVASSSAGGVTITNHSAGSVQLAGDTSGYYLPGTTGMGDTEGAFLPDAAPLMDTRTGQGGVPKRAIGPGGSVSFQVGFDDGATVALHLVVASSTSSGWLAAFPSPTAGNQPGRSSAVSVLNYTQGQQQSNLAMVRTSDGGVTVVNHSTGSIQLAADMLGVTYDGDGGHSEGLPTAPGMFVTVPAVQVLDTRSGLGGVPKAALAPGAVITAQVAPASGIPTGATVALHVVVASSASSGWLAAYPSGGSSAVSVVNYTAGQQQSNLALVSLGSDGRVTIANHSGSAVQVAADVTGYIRTTALTVPASSTSRYIASASGIAGEGCSDAASSLILLHAGTQSVTPELSASSPGVALSRTDPVTRLTYNALTTALTGYLGNLGECRSTSSPAATVVIDTTSDGSFADQDAIHPYDPATRAKDWWSKVVSPLQQVSPAGVTVVAGLDAEASFGGSYNDVLTWEQNYLSAAQGTGSSLVWSGSLDNCADQVGSPSDCGPVGRADSSLKSQTWTFANYVTLTYALSPSRIAVLPQVYWSDTPGFADQAGQWANLEQRSGNRLTFAGVLSEAGVDGDTQSPQRAWTALHYALLNVFPQVVLPGATDLQPS